MTTRPMSHVGWARACSGVTVSSCSRVNPRKGPPDAVTMSFAHLVRTTRAQRLGDRRVLAVDRDELRSRGRSGPQHHVASDDEGLLVRQCDVRAGLQRRQSPVEARGTRHGVEHDVGGQRGDRRRGLRADLNHLDRVRQRLAGGFGGEGGADGGPGLGGGAGRRERQTDRGDGELHGLGRELRQVPAGGEPRHAEASPMQPEHVAGLGADRACGSDYTESSYSHSPRSSHRS